MNRDSIEELARKYSVQDLESALRLAEIIEVQHHLSSCTDKQKEILKEVLLLLYFADSSDYLWGLHKTKRILLESLWDMEHFSKEDTHDFLKVLRPDIFIEEDGGVKMSTEKRKKVEKVVQSLGETDQKILEEALSPIYFNDSYDYRTGLWDIAGVILGDKYDSDDFSRKDIVCYLRVLDPETFSKH